MIFGIHSLGARNATLADLGLELDPTSLAALLGYSAKVMTEHAARAFQSYRAYSQYCGYALTPKLVPVLTNLARDYPHPHLNTRAQRRHTPPSRWEKPTMKRQVVASYIAGLE